MDALIAMAICTSSGAEVCTGAGAAEALGFGYDGLGVGAAPGGATGT